MIHRLAIHRFRGIRQGIVEDLAKINLLIGPNNSGKTALLELLYLAGMSNRQCTLITPSIEPSARPALTLAPTDMLGYEPLVRLRERHGYRPDGYEGYEIWLNENDDLSVQLTTLPIKHPLHEFRLAGTFAKRDLARLALFTVHGQHDLPPQMIPSFFDEQRVLPEAGHWHYLWDQRWVYRWSPQADIDRIGIWSTEGDMPKHVLLFDFHAANAHFTPTFAQRTYNKMAGWEIQIAESLMRVFPAWQGIRVSIKPALDTKGWTGYLEFPDQAPLEIDQFGDGARHAFKVLATLIALIHRTGESQPGLFLWEDPELFMHPATLGRLLDEVVRLIAERPVQLFLSTQSLEVLAWLMNTLESEHNLIKAEDVRTLRLELVEGTLKIKNLKGDALVAWFDLIGDPRIVSEDEMVSPLARLLRSGRGEE
ncbi:AAA family ATPase [Chloroflexus sp.]|uniref:AAA family ATPase n=1 Tax=Chloroflexus sp. TaxID=1904827 RepID=UPI00404A0A5F